MPDLGTLSIWLLVVASLAGIAMLVMSDRQNPVRDRLLELPKTSSGRRSGAEAAAFPLAPATVVATTLPTQVDLAKARRLKEQEKDNDLSSRVIQAGFYSPRAVHLVRAVRIWLTLAPLAAGVMLARLGWFPLQKGLLIGLFAAGAGMIAPSFWLDYRKQARITKMRRALPDAMDVMLICLEAGLSLPASIARVGRELGAAHPLLARELKIVERQVQMGRSVGEALRELGRRFDMEELRSMSAVVIQAERMGSSVASAMEVFANTLRQRRHQLAEEKAHKAGVKLVFPLVLCIFPAMLIVVAGPGAIIIYEQLIKNVLQ